MLKKILLLCFLLSLNTHAQIDNDYLQIGETAPEIVGVDQFSNTINSAEILKNDQILLMFYRGNWCGYCKKQLVRLQSRLEELSSNGMYVIVVTPEKVEKVVNTVDKLNLKFSVLHDRDNKIMTDFKVLFDVNEETVPRYLSFTRKRISAYNMEENDVLPVPATYVIDKNRRISYVHYDPDYRNRVDFDDLIEKTKQRNP